MKLDKRDYRFVLDKPDADFSPERNKKIIEDSIRAYELKRSSVFKKFYEGVRERAEAVASFLDHVNKGGGNDVDKYFGPKMLAKLRGLEILDEIKSARLNMITTPSPVYVEGGMVKNVKGVIVGKEVSNVKKKPQRKKKLG